MNRFFLQAGTLLAGLSVALGAFGAHAFKAALEATNRTDTFETAARYQMYGALALILVGILTDKISHKFLNWAGYSLLIGTLIFAGSLYLICATGVTMWGAIAPIGGTALIVGFVFLFLGVSKKV